MAKSVSAALNKRIFVIMTAQSEGWGFARDLEFYQQGTYGYKVYWCLDQVFIKSVVGGEADPDYLKVAKKHAKKRERMAESRPRGSGFKRGRGYGRGRGHYSDYSAGYQAAPQPQWSQVNWSQPPQPSAAAGSAASASYSQAYSFKSQMRCNNCGERGHFAKECPRGPLPAYPK